MTDNKNITSDFVKEFDFSDIRPYYDGEVKPIINQLISDPMFMQLINYVWPTMTFDDVQSKADKIDTNMDFQLQFMHAGIREIVERSSTTLSSSGFDKLDKNKNYLFVGNHRDILLDAAILQILLVEHGLPTSEISFGSNLKEKGFVTDFGKVNRMFTVLREGTSKELYEISRKLSAYIRHTITEKKVSVWIAQRNGRTKDGADFTQSGLIKMLNISGKQSFIENFEQLNVVPLTISYEYEPCDYLKTQELYLSNLHTKYTKSPGEDLNSIITGIKQNKGRIHVAIGTPLEPHDFKGLEKFEIENDKVKAFAAIIDRQIYDNYQLFPVNYIAADLQEKSYKRSNKYTEAEKKNFLDYMDKQIKKISGEEDALKQLFLRIYATPVINKGE